MHRRAELNADGLPLEADHSDSRSSGNQGLADRLLLATCNRSRQAGRPQDEPTHDVHSEEW